MLRAPEFPFTAVTTVMASRPHPVATPFSPLDAGRRRSEALRHRPPFAGADDEAPASPSVAAPAIVLIDAVERRIRALGHDPVRSFDPQRRWRLEAAAVVIAEGRSLDELARAAHAWLETHGGAAAG